MKLYLNKFIILLLMVLLILFYCKYNKKIERFSCCNDSLMRRNKDKDKDNKVKIIS